MKHFLTLALALLWAHLAVAQNPVMVAPGGMPLTQPQPPSPDYKPFDLDFPGGTPLEPGQSQGLLAIMKEERAKAPNPVSPSDPSAPSFSASWRTATAGAFR